MDTNAKSINKMEPLSYMQEVHSNVLLYEDGNQEKRSNYSHSNDEGSVTIIQCPLSRLTPISRTKHLTLKRKKQLNLSKSLKRNGWNVNIGKVIHDELLTLVSKIQHQTRSELKNLLREAKSTGQGETFRQRKNGENQTKMFVLIC